jgi:thioredoxin reductase (NADPH)
MSEAIENFPGFPGGISTPDLIQRMKEQVDELGIEIIAEEVSDIDCVNKLVKAGGKEYTAKAIIIATGAKPRRLNVPGEERLTGRGISYCATCDAPFFKDKNVVVVGGGDAVAEEALYLARFAREVIIVHRRDDLRASVILQERLQENKKINFILSSVIVEITGSARVEAVKVKDLKTGKEKKVDCDGVFIFIGYDPDTQVFKNKLQLDESGFIMTSDTLAASEEGVFACGDCRKKSLYQVITACADGAVAADSAYKYIVAKR